MHHQFPETIGFQYQNNRSRHRVALVFPDTYAVAMANLGFIYLYQTLLAHPEVCVERFFADPAVHNGRYSLETETKLTGFRTVMVSLPYENNIINLVGILRQADISLPRQPGNGQLLIAGGAALTMNPLLARGLADAVYLGEAEDDLPEIIDKMLRTRAETFVEWATNHRHFITFAEKERYPKRISRIDDLNRIDTCSRLLAARSVFSNTLLIEMVRGCGCRCNFCVTGHGNGRRRIRSGARILELLDQPGLSRKAGIIGSDLRPDRDFAALLDGLDKAGFTAGFSSFRHEIGYEPEILAKLAGLNVKTITVAPETATERMSRVIGKPYFLNDIDLIIDNIRAAGIENIKLYFMAGLPEERTEDVDSLIALARQLDRRRQPIQISISGFVPKPWTPWARAEVDSEATMRTIIRVRREINRLDHVNVNDEQGKGLLLELLLARADSESVMRLTDGSMNKKTILSAIKNEAKNVDNNLSILSRLIA